MGPLMSRNSAVTVNRYWNLNGVFGKVTFVLPGGDRVVRLRDSTGLAEVMDRQARTVVTKTGIEKCILDILLD